MSKFMSAVRDEMALAPKTIFPSIQRAVNSNRSHHSLTFMVKASIELQSENPDFLHELAIFMIEQEKFYQARLLMNEVLKENFKNPSYLFTHSKLLTKIGEHKEAELYFIQAQRYGLRDPDAYMYASQRYERRNDLQRAIETAETAIKFIEESENKEGLKELNQRLEILQNRLTAAKAQELALEST